MPAAKILVLGLSAAVLVMTFRGTIEGVQPSAAELRYDGKSLAEWRAYLLIELKAERRIEALTAMASFGLNGQGNAAASAILEFIKRAGSEFVDSDETSEAVLEKARWALRRIGSSSSESLVKALGDPNRHIREFSKELLMYRGIPVAASVFPLIVQMIEAEDREVRDATIEVLKWRLCSAGGESYDLEVREKLTQEYKALFVSAFKKREERRVFVKKLLQAFEDESGKAQNSIPLILGQFGTDGSIAVTALLEKLRDKESNRADIALALGRIGRDDKRVVPALVETLGMPDLRWGNTGEEWAEREARRAAATALGELGREARSAVPKLLAAVRPGKREIGPQAIDALRKIGVEADQFVPVLIEALKKAAPSGDDKELAEKAVDAFGIVGPRAKSAVPVLTQVFLDLRGAYEVGNLRIAIAKALGQIGPCARDALPALREAMEEANPLLRHTAALAIQKIGRD